MAGLLSVSLTGLNAAQAALNTTSHNISNASVTGYNRQQVVQTTADPMFTGVGFFGQGTEVATVKRIYSQFLTAQVMTADTSRVQYETYYNQIKQVDNLLSDATAGLNPALEEFFRGVQQVAADPSSVPSRQSMLSTSEALATRFQAMQTRFQEIRDGVETQIGQSVTEINSLANKIADMNRKIVTAQAAGPNVPANDLLDMRETIVAQLNQQIKTTTTSNSDGTLNVFIGSGQPLVMGSDVFTLSTTPSTSDPGRSTVGVRLLGGAVVPIPESLLSGGTLGGLLSYRTDSLDVAQNELGRVAMGLVTRFNAQHKLGQDLDGQMGGNYFAALSPYQQNLPNLVTSAASTATISTAVTSVAGLSASDYVLAFDGTNYSLTRTSDSAVMYSGTSLPGHSVTRLAGASTAAYTVTPTANATGLAENYVLSFDGTNYSLAKQNGGALVYSGTTPPTSVEGLTIGSAGVAAAGDSFLIQPAVEGLSFTGTMATGDRVLIQPTRYAARDISVAIQDTRLVAAASPVRASAANTNSGTGALTQPLANSLTGILASAAAHIATPITLTFDATLNQFNVTGSTPATIAYNPASNAVGTSVTLTTPNLTFSISGRPANGDVFTISTNVNGTKDGRNANSLYTLQSAKDLLGGTASFGYAYSQMVSEVGSQTNAAKINASAQQGLLDQATAAQQGLSGVNLDEEAANLLRYQQVYQAAARCIGVANTLFDDILSIMG